MSAVLKHLSPRGHHFGIIKFVLLNTSRRIATLRIQIPAIRIRIQGFPYSQTKIYWNFRSQTLLNLIYLDDTFRLQFSLQTFGWIQTIGTGTARIQIWQISSDPERFVTLENVIHWKVKRDVLLN